MKKTHKEMCNSAVLVQDGCNPRGIARLLVDAIDSACDQNGGTRGASGDAVVYLIMDKLASLGLYNQSFNTDDFGKHYKYCKEQSSV